MKWYMKKHLQTKHNILVFWFQVGEIKISEIFYKIQKFLRTSWAPIITTNGINFLMARPFGTKKNQDLSAASDIFKSKGMEIYSDFT